MLASGAAETSPCGADLDQLDVSRPSGFAQRVGDLAGLGAGQGGGAGADADRAVIDGTVTALPRGAVTASTASGSSANSSASAVA